MGGFKHLLFRIIPIATLMLFLCYGISIIFPIANITYLQQIQTNNSVTGGAGYTYVFDWNSYMKAFSFEPLKVAFENVFDVNPFLEVFNSIGETWKNGYQPGDMTITLGNISILTLDAVITLFNIFIGLTRAINGIILTLLSLLGININADVFVFKSLIMCTQLPNIPMIPAIDVGLVSDFFQPVVTVPVVLPPVITPPVIGT